MGELSASVGDMPLPGSLLETIKTGRWRPPQNEDLIRAVFGDDPDWPQFYDLETMARQNRFFQTKSEAQLNEEVVGSSEGLGINPALAVIIGSLGADMPIVLDYRVDPARPRVIYLASDGWREVATDFETLKHRLAL